ncbi:hypothetical protein ABZ622_27685 [Streptomyces sp. NPDC007164]|uniref:hypothetical protein n=1 Tax=Streptomyces sp. NPDC007164 TaxID=3156918 RepID=UPI0034108BC6
MTTSETPRTEYHFNLTVQKPTPGGYIVADGSGCITPETGWTRYDTFRAIRAEYAKQQPHLAGAGVTFLSLEPNQL